MADENEFEEPYLYRVENYLIHKYQPDLVWSFKVSFMQARVTRTGLMKKDEANILTREQFAAQLAQDLSSNVQWKPKNQTHRAQFKRPNIGENYQRQFTEL
jgi:hypothetical protein